MLLTSSWDHAGPIWNKKFKGKQVNIFAYFCKLGGDLDVIVVETLPREKHGGRVGCVLRDELKNISCVLE